jgi:hypothetical protein
MFQKKFFIALSLTACTVLTASADPSEQLVIHEKSGHSKIIVTCEDTNCEKVSIQGLKVGNEVTAGSGYMYYLTKSDLIAAKEQRLRDAVVDRNGEPAPKPYRLTSELGTISKEHFQEGNAGWGALAAAVTAARAVFETVKAPVVVGQNYVRYHQNPNDKSAAKKLLQHLENGGSVIELKEKDFFFLYYGLAELKSIY